MTSQQILGADLLDILFEHRNKTYGAYQLRRTYQQRLVRAVSIAVSTAFLLLFFFRPNYAKTTDAGEDGKVVVVTQIVPPAEQKKPDLPKPPETPKAQIRQLNFTDQIALKKEVADPPPSINLLAKAAISDVTTTGADVPAIQPPSLPDSKGTETQNRAAEQEPKKEVVPDKQPQFPGGMQAWIAFLSRNLHAPEELESGEKKVVIIRFHVAEDGSVTNFQVEKSAGTAFDEEVIRVLKKMPKWTPATKAGQPVSVSFTQPVTFIGVEE
jgi:protein TonB